MNRLNLDLIIKNHAEKLSEYLDTNLHEIKQETQVNDKE